MPQYSIAPVQLSSLVFNNCFVGGSDFPIAVLSGALAVALSRQHPEVDKALRRKHTKERRRADTKGN